MKGYLCAPFILIHKSSIRACGNSQKISYTPGHTPNCTSLSLFHAPWRSYYSGIPSIARSKLGHYFFFKLNVNRNPYDIKHQPLYRGDHTKKNLHFQATIQKCQSQKFSLPVNFQRAVKSAIYYTAAAAGMWTYVTSQKLNTSSSNIVWHRQSCLAYIAPILWVGLKII